MRIIWMQVICLTLTRLNKSLAETNDPDPSGEVAGYPLLWGQVEPLPENRFLARLK